MSADGGAIMILCVISAFAAAMVIYVFGCAVARYTDELQRKKRGDDED